MPKLVDRPRMVPESHQGVGVDCTITVDDAEATMASVNVLADGHDHPMLVDVETARTVTRGARTVFALPCSASRIAVLGSSPVDHMLANLFPGVNSPPCPARFFTSRHMAMAWLRTGAHEDSATA